MVLPKGTYTDNELGWFRQIYDTYYESIRNYAYFKTGNPQLADDIVQDSFLKLWSLRHKVRNETIKPLLYTIATNIIKNQFKHRQVEYRFSRVIPHETVAENADSNMISFEFQRKLEQAISQIPEGPRIVFLMSRMENLTYYEIADRLNLSVKAIEKRMNEALKLLRSRIEFKL